MTTQRLFALLLLFAAAGILAVQEKQATKSESSSPGPAASSAVPQPAHPYKISPEDAARKNPIRFTEASVARGKKVYLTQCAMCHGKNGDGKGEMVEELQITPPDFTKPELHKRRTDGELFAIIGVGSEKMPGQGSRMTDKHKWDIVNFLRATGGRKPEKSSEKESDENILIVPQ